MSISTDPFPIQATLTGSGETINVTEYFLEDGDLEVWKTVSGVDTLLVLNTDYTVSGAGNEAGGSITMTGGRIGMADHDSSFTVEHSRHGTDVSRAATFDDVGTCV